IIKMAEAAQGDPALFGLYHYSDEGAASWYDFAVAIVEEARRLGMKLRCEALEPIPTSAYPTPAVRPCYSVLDKTKIKERLGLAIPQWQSSLTAMMSELSREGGF
ncbi:MAG: sugar nucleotide-binding protein, partial [Thermodesulfobacteriota bacterium]